MTTALRRQVQAATKTHHETAPPLVKRYRADGIEFEPGLNLRHTKHIPLAEPGGIEGAVEREVWPHVPDAWVVPDSAKIGYEISLPRCHDKPTPVRTLVEIEADIRVI